jgi:hypothetical protein
VPIAAPVLIALGIDPIWLGVMVGVNLQTSFLTPPFGFALFYLRGVAGAAVKTLDIYRGAVPYVVLQVGGIALLWLAPEMATYLPDVLFAPEAPAAAEAMSTAPVQPAGSPVADDFSDLLEAPSAAKNKPYLDDFENLVPK